MKIAFVTREFPPSLRVGGIGFYVRDLATKLVEMGHDVHVVAASDELDKAYIYQERGYFVHRLSGADFYPHSGRAVLPRLLSKFRETFLFRSYRKKLSVYLHELVRKESIDIVEFSEFGAEFLFWIVSKTAPTVIRLHGPSVLDRATGEPVSGSAYLKRWMWRPELSMLHLADAVTAPSQAMADWVIGRFAPALHVHVLSNSIDMRLWSEVKERSEKKTVFFAGTLVESKGVLDLYEAVKEVRNTNPDVELVLAGRMGSAGQYLCDLITSNPALYMWLKILGPVDRKTLGQWYGDAKVCVFPSWWEPFGLVCAEAMATGALVIGSSAGGMLEIIEHGRNGFLVKPRNKKSLVQAIMHAVLMSESESKVIRSNAANSVRERFDSDSIAMDCERLYFETIKSSHKS